MRNTSQDNAERLASEFLSRFHESGAYMREHIEELARLAVSPDEETAKSATKAIFASLVERLADSFELRGVTLYNRLFSQLIHLFRNQDRLFDSRLTDFGLAGEQDILARAERLRRVRRRAVSPEVKRVIMLSRVTLGADVAVTSVLIERLKRVFPEAEIALAGGRKTRELFGGDERLSFREVAYQRSGTMADRLLGWMNLLDCVGDLTSDLVPGECLIADPDTRLTQLGLLPLIRYESRAEDPANYLFFPSREYGSDTTLSLGELASAWLGEVFGEDETTFPRLSLAANDIDKASALIEQLRRGGAQRIVTINFGVGENPAKRVSDDFEESLVNLLIQEGATIILDRGAGEMEAKRADAIIGSVASARHQNNASQIIEADEETLPGLLKLHGVETRLLVWRGRIGLLAAMIGESDLYIGYDSAGQHIAAALGVPTINVFAGFSSPRMIERWRPTGPAEARIIAVDMPKAGADEILRRVIDCARAMLKNGQRT